MTEGIRKQDLPNFLLCLKDIYSNDNEYMQDYDVEKLLAEYCTELDPWLPIDENTPKDQDILVYAPPYQYLPELKQVCKWHESAGFCIDELRTPTHYKLLK